MKLQSITWLVLVIGMLSCKASEETGKSGAEIIFGSGGGFTGATHTYHLKKDGLLFEVNSLAKTPHQIGTVEAKKTKALFKQIKASGIEKDSFNAPGNMYRFVGFIENGKEYRVTWGSHEQLPPASYTALYDALMAIVPKSHD